MESIFTIDAEYIFSKYGAKYADELQFLSQIIEICFLEEYVHNIQRKPMLISTVRQRIIINCSIENYRNVLHDLLILHELHVEIENDAELKFISIEAEFGTYIQNMIENVEEAQSRCEYYMDMIINQLFEILKAIDMKKIFHSSKKDSSDNGDQIVPYEVSQS
ncbi:hypothetical protein I4U23_023184 [Adineta vaga]|nr:hypothetical protein I4U23_023184 [Adineta vaga]